MSWAAFVSELRPCTHPAAQDPLCSRGRGPVQRPCNFHALAPRYVPQLWLHRPIQRLKSPEAAASTQAPAEAEPVSSADETSDSAPAVLSPSGDQTAAAATADHGNGAQQPEASAREEKGDKQLESGDPVSAESDAMVRRPRRKVRIVKSKEAQIEGKPAAAVGNPAPKEKRGRKAAPKGDPHTMPEALEAVSQSSSDDAAAPGKVIGNGSADSVKGSDGSEEAAGRAGKAKARPKGFFNPENRVPRRTLQARRGSEGGDASSATDAADADSAESSESSAAEEAKQDVRDAWVAQLDALLDVLKSSGAGGPSIPTKKEKWGKLPRLTGPSDERPKDDVNPAQVEGAVAQLERDLQAAKALAQPRNEDLLGELETRTVELCQQLVLSREPQRALQVLAGVHSLEAAPRDLPVSLQLGTRLVEALLESAPREVAACLAVLPPAEQRFFQAALRGAGRSWLVRAIEEQLTSDARFPDGPTFETWVLLVRAYGNVGKPELAVETFEAMRAAGCWDGAQSAGAAAANVLLNAISGDAAAAFLWFEGLLEAGLKPDTVTYNTLLKACMGASDAQWASAAFQHMRERGVRGDDYTYNTLIKAFSYAGYTEGIDAVRGWMEDAGHTPGPPVIGSLITALGRAGQYDSAYALYRDLRDGGTAVLDRENYHAMLNVCVYSGNRERAERVLADMAAAGISKTTITNNIAIKACGAVPGQRLSPEGLAAALAIADGMRADGAKLDVVTYGTLIDLCAEAGEGAKAVQLFKEMEGAGIRPDTAVCTALIKAAGGAGLLEDASEVFRRMVWGPARMRPSRATFLTMARAARDGGDIAQALHVYAGMRKAGFPPCNSEFQALMRACAESSIVEGASSEAVRDMGIALWARWRDYGPGGETVDLHGFTAKEARFAVLSILASLQERTALPPTSDLVLITGAGRNSPEEPVLRRTLTRLLAEELHPPLLEAEGGSYYESGDVDANPGDGAGARRSTARGNARGRGRNAGRIVVSRRALVDWLRHKANKRRDAQKVFAQVSGLVESLG